MVGTKNATSDKTSQRWLIGRLRKRWEDIKMDIRL
jgi:hypothetical protein